MLEILSITVPIYSVIAIGFLVVRFDLFSKSDMRVLGNVDLVLLEIKAISAER